MSECPISSSLPVSLNCTMGSDSDAKAVGEKIDQISSGPWTPPTDWVLRFKDEYSGKHASGTETLPPGADPDQVAASVLTMNEEESVRVLKMYIVTQQQDYTFDQTLMRRLEELVEGHEACSMEQGEWAYEVRALCFPIAKLVPSKVPGK